MEALSASYVGKDRCVANLGMDIISPSALAILGQGSHREGAGTWEGEARPFDNCHGGRPESRGPPFILS